MIVSKGVHIDGEDYDNISGEGNRLGYVGEPDVFQQIADKVNDGRLTGQIIDNQSGEVICEWTAEVEDGMALVRLFSGYREQWAYHEGLAKDYMLVHHDIAPCWTTSEVQQEFEITGFLAPYCGAVRKSDRVKGTLMFGDIPPYRTRLYYDFRPY